MTSNIASQQIQQLREEQGSDWEIEAHVKDALKTFFKPEFLNRIDEVVVFQGLNKEALRKVVEIQLRSLSDRLKERQIRLEFTDKAQDLIMELGYDPAFGARPLKRTIQQQIENPLASELLAGRFADGDVVRVDAEGSRFTFVRGKAA